MDHERDIDASKGKESGDADSNGNIIISHATSAAYWRHVGSSQTQKLRPSNENPLDNCARPKLFPDIFTSSFPAFLERPINLLVPDKRFTRIDSNLNTHIAPSTVPQRSYFNLAPRLYACSPEFTTVQLSRFRSLAQLIEQISELTADYYIHPRTGALKRRSQRIASRESITAFANEAISMRGARKVTEAASYALEHARSPMEIKAGLLIGLPLQLGGFRFPTPTLNYQVSSETLRNAIEQDYFLVDIAFPESKVGVEYYGEDTHPDDAADRRRLNGLRALGWKILTLEKLQLYDVDLFLIFMRQLSLLLDQRIETAPGWIDRHMKLRADLKLLRVHMTAR